MSTLNRLPLESGQAGQNYPSSHNKREEKLAETILKNKNVEDEFEQAPTYSAVNQATGALLASEAAAAQVIAFRTERSGYEYYHAAVESTGTAVYNLPKQSADGLELPLDADQTDGVTAFEIGHGVTANSRAAFTVGTDAGFFVEATIKIDDISDLGQLFVGFRKAAAYTADPDDYTDMAAWHVGETGGTVADGQLNIATILNNAATTYTDTTETDWADGDEFTLRVEVDGQGRCTFLIDGDEPAVTKQFTLDDGDTVIPFLFVESTGASSSGDPGVSMSSWRVGRK
jgi:hypothetical protein